jgi:FAD synthetase
LVRVLATGTFDILHPGHLLFLEEAKKYGSELWVIVACNVMIKHKPKPLLSETQRLKMIRALKVVDHAVLGDEHDIFRPLEDIKPDIIVLGYDQFFDVKELEEKIRLRGIQAKVVRINAHEPCSTCSTGAIIKLIRL